MLVCGHYVTDVYALGVGWKEMEKSRNGGEKALRDTKANASWQEERVCCVQH